MQNKIATETFKKGFNCAQSVVAAFAPEVGISRELSLKLASGLGGGVCQGGSCGAVVGAYIILGLHRGVDDEAGAEDKAIYNKLKQDFSAEFLKKNGSLMCHELLAGETDTPEKIPELKANDEFMGFCTNVVKSSACILEKMLKE